LSLAALAKLLGVKRHTAEDALHSERSARAVLSRRELFAAGGALAVGSAFSFLRPMPELSPMMATIVDINSEVIVGLAKQMAWVLQLSFNVALGGQSEADYRERIRQQMRSELMEVLYR